jgi:tetratricopeptide (TPR) repeat protein
MIRRALIPMVLLLAVSFAIPAPAADPAMATAQHQFDVGAYSAAVVTLQGVISRNKSDAQAYYLLARCYYELHDYNAAIAQAEQATRLDPQNSVYHLWLGRAYGMKADKEHSFFSARKVKREFEEAVRLNPAHIQARRDLEEFDLEAPWIVGGSKDLAMEQVNAIAAQDQVEGHLARAQYWQDAKKPDLVEAEYGWVLQLKPQRVEPYLEVVDYYSHQNNAAKMQAAIDAAAQLNASDPRLAYYHGVAGVVAAKHLSEAEQYLKSYLASTPDRSDWPSHAAAREWLGKLYERMGKRMDAAEQYRAALQLDSGRKEARDNLRRLEKPPK